MKILVAGAGGLGGYYGARLAAVGNDVWFLARGATLETLQDRGLELRSDLGDLRLEHVHASSEATDPADFVLFCVKTYDNESAAEAIPGAVVDGTAICSFQNGVDNESFLRERFPQAVVLGGTSRIEAYRERPGVIVQRGDMQDVTIGAFDLEERPVAARLGTAFDAAGVPVTLAADIVSALWVKLLIICGVGSITAYTGGPWRLVMADERLGRMLRELMDEVAAVAEAREISLPDGVAAAVEARTRNSLDPDFLSSMARDRLAGRPLEVDALNGAVVRYGETAGVPTPANQAVLEELLPLHREAMARRVAG